MVLSVTAILAGLVALRCVTPGYADGRPSGVAQPPLYTSGPKMTVADDVARLVRAIEGNDAGRARELLERDPALAIARWKGTSVVILAVAAPAPEVLDALLEKRRTLDLYEAAALGDIEDLNARITEDPGRINAPSEDGRPALALAAQYGQSVAVATLVFRGADPDQPLAENGRTPLHLAVERQHLKSAQSLLRSGADPDPPDDAGWTPLHVAAALGRTNVAQMLIAFGADPDAENAAGETPAEVAASHGHRALCSILANPRS